jgi:alcohol dehydrogenase class IV
LQTKNRKNSKKSASASKSMQFCVKNGDCGKKFIDYFVAGRLNIGMKTKTEKTGTTSTRIDKAVHAALKKQTEDRNQPLQAVVDHACRLWMTLPVTVQATLLSGEGDENELVSLIRSIVVELKSQK